jgi:acetyltransferase-like isoleucine patch superfamily enzyme
MRRVRRWWFRQRGASIAPGCWIQPIEVPRNPWDVQLGHSVMLDRGVVLIASGDPADEPRIQIGKHVYINRSTILDASLSITIGDDTMIGPNCYLTDHDHGLDLDATLGEQPLVEAPLHIGDNVWIGAHATILKGVTVGEQAVVAAGAVVTQDVPPRTIVGGVPARPLRTRE